MVDAQNTAKIDVPNIQSWDDFKQISEIHETDDQGNSIPNRTTFVFFNDQGFCFRGDVRGPKDSITIDQARECLQLDSNQSMFPDTPHDMPTTDSYPFSNETNTYIKTPNATSFNAYASVSTMSSNILREAKILELVSNNPHPNLVDFRGAVVKNDRIVGFALNKYPSSLAQYMKSGAYGAGSGNGKSLDSLSTENKKEICDGIEAGLDHLHSLGLAHNDVNPANIMFNESGTPVIVDLGSCRLMGEVLHERGTVGWNQGFKRTSELENDRIGLGKIREWLGVPEDRKVERNADTSNPTRSEPSQEKIDSPRDETAQRFTSYSQGDAIDRAQPSSNLRNEVTLDSVSSPHDGVASNSIQKTTDMERADPSTRTVAGGTFMNYRPNDGTNTAGSLANDTPLPPSTGAPPQHSNRSTEISPTSTQPPPSVIPSKHALDPDQDQKPDEAIMQKSKPTTWMSYR